MDLGAFMIGENKLIRKYVAENFGRVPHYRGVRFMKLETPYTCRNRGMQSALFEKYCGQDVIYFHVFEDGCDKELDQWRTEYFELFLSSVNEPGTDYRDYYFRAPVTDDYEKICEGLKNGEI